MQLPGRTVLLFPGQGAQRVGMQGPPSEIRDKVFDQAERVLGYDLRAIIEHGPAEKLNATRFSQPAIFVCTWLALQLLQNDRPELFEAGRTVVCAGLSLGEYTALAAAGAMSFEDALRLVDARAEAMHEAASAEPGAMMTVLGLEAPALEQVCRKASDAGGGLVQVANYLFPKGYVVSGDATTVQGLQDPCRAAGAALCKVLPVSGAFHTAFMRPAAERLREAIAAAALERLPGDRVVYSNVTGMPYPPGAAPAQFSDALVEQLVKPVRWEQTLATIAQDFGAGDTLVEVGPGRQLRSMLMRVPNSRTALQNYTNVDCAAHKPPTPPPVSNPARLIANQGQTLTLTPTPPARKSSVDAAKRAIPGRHRPWLRTAGIKPGRSA